MNPAPPLKEIDLLERFTMGTTDSLNLVGFWKEIVSDLDDLKTKSLDTVTCWSCEDYQQGYYQKYEALIIDSCISRYILPLRESHIWELLKTDDYSVNIQKLESENEGHYCISFPRDQETGSIFHLFKHSFYFKKVGVIFLFAGYIFN